MINRIREQARSHSCSVVNRAFMNNHYPLLEIAECLAT